MSWAPLLAWAGAVSYLSSLSSVPGALSGDRPGGDVLFFFPAEAAFSLAHLGEYFVLSLLAWWAAHLGRHRWWWLALALGLLLGYAGLDEYHQSFVPGRSASAGDFGLDAAGVALGFLLALALGRLVRLRRAPAHG